MPHTFVPYTRRYPTTLLIRLCNATTTLDKHGMEQADTLHDDDATENENENAAENAEAEIGALEDDDESHDAGTAGAGGYTYGTSAWRLQHPHTIPPLHRVLLPPSAAATLIAGDGDGDGGMGSSSPSQQQQQHRQIVHVVSYEEFSQQHFSLTAPMQPRAVRRSGRRSSVLPHGNLETMHD